MAVDWRLILPPAEVEWAGGTTARMILLPPHSRASPAHGAEQGRAAQGPARRGFPVFVISPLAANRLSYQAPLPQIGTGRLAASRFDSRTQARTAGRGPDGMSNCALPQI